MNKSFQLGWWLVLLTIVCMYAVAIPFSFLFPTANEYTVSIIGEVGILIPVIIGTMYILKNGGSLKASLGISSFSPKLVLPSVILTFGAQFFIIFVTLPVQVLFIILFGADTATSQMLVPTDIKTFILAFSAVCIAAPVFEELLCRSVLIKLFERYGSLSAIIYSSAAFALLHLEARSVIPIFFLGMLFGILRICTGSVLLTMILHSVNNFFALCQLIPADTGLIVFLPALGIICAVIFPFLAFYMFKKSDRYFKYSATGIKDCRTGFSLAALICFILFVAVNLILFLQRLINGDIVREILQLIGIY